MLDAQIPKSSEGKDWFYYVDPTATHEMLEVLTSEFLAILDKCPSRLKRQILAGGGRGTAPDACFPGSTPNHNNNLKPPSSQVTFGTFLAQKLQLTRDAFEGR